jgi:ribosome-binding protein aMBF1 (putative translation factor)
MKTLRQQLNEAREEIERLREAVASRRRKPVKGWLGGVIQQYREARGWSLHELSRRSGVAPGLLSRIETKRGANPTLDVMLRLAGAFGNDLSKLFQEWENELRQDP